MSREVLLLVDALSREKNVGREIIFGALEDALSLAVRKRLGENLDIIVHINRETGSRNIFRRWLVIPNEVGLDFPEKQELLSDALDIDPNIKLGEYIQYPIDDIEFGRISAQVAKQFILQRIRDAERDQILNDFLSRGEAIVSGVIKRLDKGDLIVDLGRIEGRLPRSELIPKENFRIGERVKAFILKIDRSIRSQQVILSRITTEFVSLLFSNEVPEIEQKLLEIKSVARDPGIRAKIAVVSHDKRLDPIGTCIGIRGSRISSVKNDLSGEQIDIILWSSDPAQFVINALAPANVDSIIIDEDGHSMDVIVDEDNLPKSIGAKGQNVRLASELTGWHINILTVQESQNKKIAERLILGTTFVNKLHITQEEADILIDEGFLRIEEIAYMPFNEFLEVTSFKETIAKEIRERARNVLLSEAFLKKEHSELSEDLLALNGITPSIIAKLVECKIFSRELLAELSADELSEMADLTKEQASELIMQARVIWFNN